MSFFYEIRSATDYNFSLGSGDNGNVNAIANRRDNTRSQNFTYDPVNRLGSAQTQTTGVTIPNSNCWGLTFGYDAWADLLTSSTTGPAGCSEPTPLNVSVNPATNQIATNTVAGQVVNFCYDAAGNLLETVVAPATCPTSGPYQNAYDAENHLTTTGTVTYTYDGDGKRVEKSNGKLYWYGTSSDPLDETDLSGNTGNSSFYEYIFFGGKRVARRDYQNNVDYYFADHLGTSRVVTNAGGTLLDDSDFYPFGGERPILSSSGNHYKFTGKERDSESGLDNFGARYMSSQYGRFMTPDPGNAGADPTNPQSWNMYSYVFNNPLRNIDPTGMECVWDDGSYDDNTDPNTGSANSCSDLGGTWVDHSYFQQYNLADWSGDPNSVIADYAFNFSITVTADAANNGDVVPANPCQYAGRNLDPSALAAMGTDTKNNPFTTTYDFFNGFSIGGYLDAQPMATGNVYEKAAYGNYVFGAYMSAAGFPLSVTLAGADGIAFKHSLSYPGQ